MQKLFLRLKGFLIYHVRCSHAADTNDHPFLCPAVVPRILVFLENAAIHLRTLIQDSRAIPSVWHSDALVSRSIDQSGLFTIPSFWTGFTSSHGFFPIFRFILPLSLTSIIRKHVDSNSRTRVLQSFLGYVLSGLILPTWKLHNEHLQS